MKQLLTIVAAMCLAATVNAQQGAQAKPAPPAQPAQAAPQLPNPFATPDEAINIRYEVRIREEGGPQPNTKTVSMISTLGDASLVRANQGTNNPLNVDVSPTSIRETKVHTRLGIEYTPQTPANPAGPPLSKLSVRQNVAVWLESGKPMVISQSADPMSDRRLTVEVTATIIR